MSRGGAAPLRRPVVPVAPSPSDGAIGAPNAVERALRFLAALNDEVLDLDEAAALMKVSPEWLEKSDVPRAPLTKPGKTRGNVRYLKSQCLAYVASRLTYRIDL